MTQQFAFAKKWRHYNHHAKAKIKGNDAADVMKSLRLWNDFNFVLASFHFRFGEAQQKQQQPKREEEQHHTRIIVTDALPTSFHTT